MGKVEKVFCCGPWEAGVDFAVAISGQHLATWAAVPATEMARKGQLVWSGNAGRFELTETELLLQGAWFYFSPRVFDQRPVPGERPLARWQTRLLQSNQGEIRRWLLSNLFEEGNPLENYFLLSIGTPGASADLAVPRRDADDFWSSLVWPPIGDEQGFVELQGRIASLWPAGEGELILLRLSHRGRQRYYRDCPELIERCSLHPEKREEMIAALADACAISQESGERILDYALQGHPVTGLIIANCLSLLYENRNLKTLEGHLLSRLDQLRQSGLHQGIPESLFDRLDQAFPLRLLPRGDELEQALRQAKQILDGLLSSASGIPLKPAAWELEKLVRAYHSCAINSDKRLEEALLNAAKIVDEENHRPEMAQVATAIREISALFEAYEEAATIINELVFHEEAGLSAKRLSELRNNLAVLQNISSALPEDLLYRPIFENRYATYYGRRKLAVLRQALDGGESVEAAALAAIADFVAEEKNYHQLYHLLSERLDRQLFLSYYEKDREAIRQRIEALLRREERLSGALHPAAFHKIYQDLCLEQHYAEEVLPAVWREGKDKLRQDFIRDSGLDWQQVESIERHFCRTHNLPEEYFDRRSSSPFSPGPFPSFPAFSPGRR